MKTQPDATPASASEPVTPPVGTSPGTHGGGWGKLILAVAAFLILPSVPQFSALVPIDRTLLLFVPTLAACALVGWWAGGRAMLAIIWVGLAAYVAMQRPDATDAFQNLVRGWCLVLAGSFGLVCIFSPRRPFFSRALIALTVSLALALIMSAIGPVSGADISRALETELLSRNIKTMSSLDSLIGQHPAEWQQLTERVPQMGEAPSMIQVQLRMLSGLGHRLFPSLLGLESLVALAIGWSMYHRLSRARLGPALGPLRNFRFNDQLVWGLIAGLAIVFVPTLDAVRVIGNNLLVFFGSLYAVRGLAVLSWFMAPGALTLLAAVGFTMFWLPYVNAIAALGFLFLAVAAFGLGLGDTWADWRNRPRTNNGEKVKG